MRLPTLVAGAVLVCGLGAAAVVGFTVAGGDTGTLEPVWVSETARSVSANHHAPAVDDGTVYAPVSDDGGEAGRCSLYALDAGDGGVRWEYRVPGAACFIHAVADPTVADYDRDGTREVLAATTENEVAAFDPTTGEKEFAHALPAYGYSPPVVADLVEGPAPEVVVVDSRGTVVVVDPRGNEAWRYALDTYVWARPAVGDLDADGGREVFVAGRDGDATLLDADGTVAWRTGDLGTVSWASTGAADDDAATEVFVATIEGNVTALDGASGAVEWRRTVGAFASVGPVVDGDGDGAPEVYVADKTGTVAALEAATGETAWETRVLSEAVQTMPAPAVGDVDGDGAREVLLAAHDGSVTVLDAATGEVDARYEREGKVFAEPTLADLDGDGDDEAVVVYADGSVVALDYR